MTVRPNALARRLAPVLLVLWVGVPGVGLTQDESPRDDAPLEQADARLELATKFFEARNFNAAEIELKNLLRDDPGLVDARLLLAQLYLRTQKGVSAEKELQRAKALGAAAQRWRFELVEAYLQQGRFQSALEELDREPLPADGRARGLGLKGRAYLGLNEFDDAKAVFAAAAELDPSDKTAASGLVQLAMLTGDMEAADQTSAGLIAQFPDDPNLLLLRAEVLRQMDDSKAAVEQFGAVLAIEPQNIPALLGRATANVRLRQFDSAREDLAAVDALQPNVVIVSYLRGVMAFYERDWDTAAEQLQMVLGAQPGHAQSQLLMGIVSYARNDLQLAEEYLSSSVGAMPDNLQAVKVLAATRLKLREPAGAVDVLEPVAGSGDAQVMALLGSAYMLAGDQVRGQEWLTRAVETAPDVAALRTQLALTLIAGGKTGEAIDELESAVDLGQDVLQADVLLVLAQLKEKRYEQAIADSTALEQRRPDSPIAYNLTGLALLAQGKLDEASARFEKAFEIDPKFNTALINLARVDVAKDDTEGAARRYRQVLEQDPRNLAALLGMAALAERRVDDSAVVEWLNKAQDANAAAVQPGLLMTRYFIDRSEYLQALTIASNLATRFPDNVNALEMLGRAQTLAGEEASAIRTFDQLLSKEPDEARIYYLKGGAQWKADDLADAAASFRRAIELKPDLIDARVALASVALAAGDHAEAQAAARALQADLPERDLGFRIEGIVLLEAGKPAEAVAPLRRALALQPNAQTARQLADAYVRSGKPGDAIAMLEQWTANTPDDPGSLALLAMLLHGEDMPERALPIYERLYSVGEANMLVLNNLAWLLHERGDPRALEIAGKAYELNPNRPEVADTFGWILFNSGERDRGLSILQQAHLAYPTQTEISYHTAVALDGMGRGNEAVTILRRLLREHPNSEQAADAQVLFDKLTGSGAG